MFMDKKRRGMFGGVVVPGTPGIGDGIEERQQMEMGDPAPGLGMRGAPLPQQPAGFERPTGLRRAAGLFADFAAGLRGKEGQYAAMLEKRRESAAKIADEQRQRALKRDDFMFEHNYRVNNPTPQRDDTFTRTLEAAGIDPSSEQGRALYRQRAETLANPVQWVTGQDGIPRPMPRSSPITAPPGVTFTPIDEGGPSQQATGGFREAFAGF